MAVELIQAIFCLYFSFSLLVCPAHANWRVNFVGFIVDFISVPVTSAFTSATSIIIVGSQLKNLLGISYSSKGFGDSLYELFMRMEDSAHWDAILAVGCCVFLLVLRVC